MGSQTYVQPRQSLEKKFEWLVRVRSTELLMREELRKEVVGEVLKET